MKIAIVHYHFDRGGVTRVAQNAIDALELQYGSDFQVCLLSGRPIHESFPCQHEVIPHLDYSSEKKSTLTGSQLATQWIEKAKELLGGAPDIWHIHNHSLGKNTAMPDAVVSLAKTGHKILLQIHDFAEDGRPANYKLISNSIENWEHLYPYSSNVQYAVLNQRDYLFLKKSNIPETYIHWLPNPVPEPKIQSAVDWDEALFPEKLRNRARVLYPVRIVRRKNIAELLLLSLLDQEERIYMNTLPPTNKQLLPLYKKFNDLINTLNIPAALGVAEVFQGNFEQIIASSEGIISTSVAEGFGLGFLEPWTMGKAVSGRDIPEITQDFKKDGVIFNHLYNSLKVPDNLIDKAKLKQSLFSSLESYYQSYEQELPDDAIDQAFSVIASDGMLEFSHLDESMQESIISKLSKMPLPERLQFCEIDNPICFDNQTIIDENKKTISDLYNLESYGQKLDTIYQTLLDNKSSQLEFGSSASILNHFLDPKRFNLLRT